ncbi:MAG: sugar ABC transporter substrate-binding protein [Chloroflexota bacterium]|nr:sugar ABC transporter substrate-binding protein [Chloroflexota bacterium]
MKERKLNRRDFLRLSAAAATGAIMAACAPATPEVVEVEKEVPVEKVKKETVVVEKEVAKPKETIELDYSFSFAVGGVPDMKRLCEVYSEENPYVDIKPLYIAERYYEQLEMRAAAGDLPDAIYCADENFPYYVEQGLYRNLQPYVEQYREELDMDDFIPITLKMFRWSPEIKVYGKGDYYALPFSGGPILWYYNKAVFEDAGVEPPPDQGWDWDMNDFLELCKKLVKVDEAGNMLRGAFPLPGWIYPMPFIRTMGGRYLTEDKKKCAMSTPESVKAIQFFMDLRHKYRVVPLSTEFAGIGSTDLFREGKIAMNITGPWWLPTLRAIPKDVLDFDLLHFPKNPETGERIVRSTYDGITIGKGSRYPDAAWEFVMYIVDPKNQPIVARADEHSLSCRISALESSFIHPEERPEHQEVFIDSQPYWGLQPITEYWPEMWTIIDKYWEKMVLEKIQMDVGEATAKICEGVDYLLEHGELPAKY